VARGRQREQEHHAQRFRQGTAEFFHIAGGGAARNRRQCRGGHGDSEESQGKLHDTEGVAEPAHRAVHAAHGIDDGGCEIGVHHHVDLHGSIAQDGRDHQAEDAHQAGMIPIERHAKTESQAIERGHLPNQLQGTTEHYADRHALDAGQIQRRAKPDSQHYPEAYGAEVEERRSQGGNAEFIGGVEDSHGLRGECNQQQERKHGARHPDGEFEFAGHSGETRGH